MSSVSAADVTAVPSPFMSSDSDDMVEPVSRSSIAVSLAVDAVEAGAQRDEDK